MAIVVAATLNGCAQRGPVLAPLLERGAESPPVELADTPFFPQEKYQCGPAALATVLGASGTPVEPQVLVPMVYLPERRGSLQAEIAAAARRYTRLPYEIPPTITALIAELRDGRPVLVLLNLGIGIAPVWHYAVVVGYLPATDELVLRSGTTRRRIMDAGSFDKSWDRAKRWALVVVEPGELPASAEPGRYTKAAAALESVGALEPAAQAYAAAVEHWPDEPSARFGLANTYYAMGKTDVAASTYRSIMKQTPDYAPAYNNLAALLSERGCHAAALKVVDEGLQKTTASTATMNTLRATRDEIAQALIDSPASLCRRIENSAIP